MATDDDELPSKKRAKIVPASSREASAPMLRLMRITRILGLVAGGFVTLVSLMAVAGLVTDNFFVRLVFGLLVAIGLPALVSDRLLKGTNMGGGLSMVADVFALVLLGAALLVVSAEGVTGPLLTREGDRYARTGSTGMAQVVYFLAGVSPAFPGEKAAGKPGASASGSASSSPSASAPTSSGGK